MTGISKISLLVLSLGFFSSAGMAEEISPSVSISPATLNAPINEQPYFGFIKKNSQEKLADIKFVTGITTSQPNKSRNQISKELISTAWSYLLKDNRPDMAAKRFNQAWLLDPSQSQIAHGFAVIVFERFKDIEYASKLMDAAHKLENKSESLFFDHGFLFLKAGRPVEAIPLLKKAVSLSPPSPLPAVNLAGAYAWVGDMKQACEALKLIPKHDNPEVSNNALGISRHAKCELAE